MKILQISIIALFVIGLINIHNVNGVLVDNTFIGSYVVKNDFALINNQTYYISKPYNSYDSNQTIIFHNVVFAMPTAFTSPPDPSGIVYSLTKFPDGSTEKLGVGVPIAYTLTTLSTHTYPQAAFTRFTNGTFVFLVSQDLGFSSPLKQFKSGVSIQSINCDSYYTLVIKAQDGSPACLKFKTAKILIERGWSTDPFIAIMEPHYGGIAGANWTGSYVIDVNMERQNTVTPMLFQIFYPNGTQYKTDSISSSDVQPDGFYKYPITIHVSSSSNQPIDREFKVQITYENETKIIHLPSLCCDIPTNSKMPQQDVMSTFMPCDTPYPQSNTGIAVLYMPANSTGKLCVDYSNPNSPRSTDVRIFEAQHLSEDTKDIRVLPSQDNIPQGNSTIVYTLKTSKIGFYGLTLFCYGTPFAVGYDNQSRIVANDFPWLGQTFFCPMQTYTFHISGLSGIEIKYLPYP